MTTVIRTPDFKRFIDRKRNPSFTAKMEERLSAGHIVPFSILFTECECRHLSDLEKQSADIIQFSFLVTDAARKVLLTSRTPLSKTAERGHTITQGFSPLIGWSPVRLPPGRSYPMSEDDVLWAYHQEVVGETLPLPALYFLGLIRNNVKGIRYYFYLFHVEYPGRSPQIPSLRKDKDDELLGFHTPDHEFLQRISGNQANLRAVQLLTGCDLSGYDLSTSDSVPHQQSSLPPFRIHAPNVFISHATGDDPASKELECALAAAGITCWTDHTTLRFGESWFREIDSAIKYGGSFVLLCSQKSRAANGVKREIELAMERKTRDHNFPIFPVSLDGDKPESSVPLGFVHYWAADLRNPSERATNLNLLVQRIKEALIEKQLFNVSPAA